MAYRNAQLQLFNQLVRKHGRPLVVEKLKQLLFLEKSALYKRMKGEKELTFSESLVIADHFGFSIDRLRSSERTVVFEFPKEKPTESHSPIAFLDTIVNDMRAMAALPNLRLRYAAAEIPLFHYFQFPELTLFKLFQWNRIAWRQPGLLASKFKADPDLFGGENALKLAGDIHQLYRNFDSSEIWATSIWDNTLAQIVFTAQIEGFESKEMPRLLLWQIAEATDRLEKMAETGKKPSHNKADRPGNLEAYHNPTAHCNNLILIESGERHLAVYATFDNPNFLKTQDSELCEYTAQAFERLASVSENISSGSEGNRSNFFKELRGRIQRAESRLQPEKTQYFKNEK